MKRMCIQWVFVVLALLAMAYLGCDYICGHSFVKVMRLEYCPVCALFHAACKSLFVVVIIVAPRVVEFRRTPRAATASLPTVFWRSRFALRAPPSFGVYG
jgi:hypothetical protein